VVEGRADDALDALAGVDVLVDGDLVGGAAAHLAADVDVDPLGVLAKDHEVDVLRAVVLERAQAVVEAAHRAHVGVEVEPEAKAEEDVPRVLVGGTRGSPRAPRRISVAGVADLSKKVSGRVVPSRR
jgi:hypothetical protein